MYNVESVPKRRKKNWCSFLALNQATSNILKSCVFESQQFFLLMSSTSTPCCTFTYNYHAAIYIATLPVKRLYTKINTDKYISTVVCFSDLARHPVCVYHMCIYICFQYNMQ